MLQIPDLINIIEAKTHDSFDFALMLNRIFAENIFVTRIKTNTDYTIVKELELPEDKDQDILKDEIITLSGKKAIETKINEHNFRLVTVYRLKDNKVIHIITNNLDWTARTIADLYKNVGILNYSSRQ